MSFHDFGELVHDTMLNLSVPWQTDKLRTLLADET